MTRRLLHVNLVHTQRCSQRSAFSSQNPQNKHVSRSDAVRGSVNAFYKYLQKWSHYEYIIFFGFNPISMHTVSN